MQRLFAFAIVILVLILGPFTYFTYEMIERFKVKNSTYIWPKFSDFWICLIVAALWMTLERVIYWISYGFFMGIARDQGDSFL